MNTRPKSSLPSAVSSCAELSDWGRRKLAATSSTPRLDTELLLAHASGRPRNAILAFPEHRIDVETCEVFRELIHERGSGVPIAYLTGRKEFYSLSLTVTPATLVPRPETELLVELTLAHIAGIERPRVLDLGTGCGAIALAVKHGCASSCVTAVDSSVEALAVAKANGERLGLDVSWLESNWFDALGDDRFDVIVSNPPYVARDELDTLPELRHEPRAALDGGIDGLNAIRDLLATAPSHLVPRGALLMEHGADQAAEVVALARSHGFRVVETRADLAGLERVLSARV